MPRKSREELEAEVERLLGLNDRLSRQVVGLSNRMEEGRRELLAIGWDAAADSPSRPTKADNPYRKPLPDFSGAIACRMPDGA